MSREKKLKFQVPYGMHDILPRDQKYFQEILKTVQTVAEFYGFRKIETPIVENAELFSKGTGSDTDIVEKEMYTFKTKGGDLLALRPEGTPPIVRAYIEHGMQSLTQPVKLWHWGPFFRHERPQAGRYRQFFQAGFEVLGERSSVIDAEIIQVFYSIFEELGFKNLVIEINSIGDSQCRPYYKKTLSSYFKSRQSSLCVDCRRRARENPLRVLDCKDEKCQRIIKSAPQIVDYLCPECHEYFKEVLEFLDDLGLPYQLNPYLVRGLDYYTKTVFEIFSTEPSNPDNASESGLVRHALAGGGRYDKLVKLLGGKDTPGCGGAMGIERIVEIMKGRKMKFKNGQRPKIFLAQLSKKAKRESLKLIEEFRKAKIPIAHSLSKDSLGAQMKIADRLGVKYVLIIGQKEVVEKEVLIRDMENGKQRSIENGRIVKEMKKKI
ncbi:MAG: histidine--tRNA ligase [Candidatus Nealsonbacteria bacterium]|nr:histidine--tRNA ligase [Candidatus Nealsonbacteria bacterium]